MLSTSACQLASITLCDTPTVPQRPLPSPDSISTRTTAAGAFAPSRHADLVIEQLDLLELRIELGERLRSAWSSALTGPLPSPRRAPSRRRLAP